MLKCLTTAWNWFLSTIEVTCSCLTLTMHPIWLKFWHVSFDRSWAKQSRRVWRHGNNLSMTVFVKSESRYYFYVYRVVFAIINVYIISLYFFAFSFVGFVFGLWCFASILFNIVTLKTNLKIKRLAYVI